MKTKISISIDHDVYMQAEKATKLMRQPNFSKYVEYVLRHYNKNPKDLIKEEIRKHSRLMSMYADILNTIEEMEAEELEEELVLGHAHP